MIIGAATVLIMAVVFVWMVVLDKATISVSTDGPYFLEVEGPGVKGVKKASCETNPCVVSVPSGQYHLKMTRGGYFDEERIVNVDRGEQENVEITFRIIPSVKETGTLKESNAVIQAAFEPENLGELFSIDMDPTYNKQRLNFHNEAQGEWTVWAYFDRKLQAPQIFPSPDLTRALIVEGDDLYLVDGVKFERSLIGSLANIESMKWSPDSPWILARTEVADDATLWFVNLESGVMKEWPFSFGLEKVVWTEKNRLVFATRGNVSALTHQGSTSTVDVLSTILTGSFKKDPSAFEFGEYDLEESNYQELYEVPTELEIDYESVRLGIDETSRKVFFSDGERVFEVVR